MFIDSSPASTQRLSLSHSFPFSCHSGLACFNSCCRNKHLPLTPYDVLRMKRALGIHSDDFLARHTLYSLDPGTGFPIVSIKMENDGEKTCPFVSSRGCTVYSDRPTSCRLYPLARAVSVKTGSEPRKEFYYLLEAPACLGTREDKVRTVEQWVRDQGLETYLAMNDRTVDFVLRAKKALGHPLDERSLRKVLVALYNVDVFREFVVSTHLLDALNVEDDLRRRVPEEDPALLELGLIYLRRALVP